MLLRLMLRCGLILWVWINDVKIAKLKQNQTQHFFGQVEQMVLVDNILLPILPNLMEEQHQPALKNNPNIDPKTKISTVIFQR